MTIIEFLGYLGAALVFATFWMKTMIPLRMVGICSNITFATYGILAPVYPLLILHAALLPLNIVRLMQMKRLIAKVHAATQGDLNLDWLKPFMTSRPIAAGETLFAKGDDARAMFFTLSGDYRLRESGIALQTGNVVGELGLLSPQHGRTQTLECVKDGEVLEIGYDKVEQLFFQNPKFGFYFLRLIAGRLFDNIARLEAELAQLRAGASSAPGKPAGA